MRLRAQTSANNLLVETYPSGGRSLTTEGQNTALALNDWATSNNGLSYTQFIQQYNYTGSVGNNGNLVSSWEVDHAGWL